MPDSSEVPARGAALFGAVAAGVFGGIGEAVIATAPPDARAVYRPIRPRLRPTTACTGSTAACTRLLGSTQVELLHGLKRIATETRRAT